MTKTSVLILKCCSNRHSPLHPLRLVVGTEGDTSEQDWRIKVHADMVPKRTKRIPILKGNQNPPPTCISELRFLLKLVTTNKAFKEIRSHLIFLTRKGKGAFRYNLWFRFTIYSPSWGRISCRNCAAQQSQSSRLSSDLGASVWTPVSPWSPPDWLRGGRLITPPAGRTHCRERAPEIMEKKSTVQRGFKEQGWGYSKLLLWTYHDKIRGNVLFRLLILAIFSDLSVNMQVYFWGTFSYFWF